MDVHSLTDRWGLSDLFPWEFSTTTSKKGWKNGLVSLFYMLLTMNQEVAFAGSCAESDLE